MATGLFVGVGYGALDTGRGEQIINQIIGIAASGVWAFVVTAAIMLVLKYTIGIKADESGENQGLDMSEHGESAFE